MAATTLRGARVSGSSLTTTLTRASARAINPNPLTTTLRRALISSTPTITVDAGTNVTSDPFQVLNLSAIASQVPDTWVWTLDATTNAVSIVSDPLNAQTVKYYAPPTVNGVVLVWKVTVTKNGVSASDTVTHIIRNHAGPWMRRNGVYRAAQFSALVSEDI